MQAAAEFLVLYSRQQQATAALYDRSFNLITNGLAADSEEVEHMLRHACLIDTRLHGPVLQHLPLEERQHARAYTLFM